MGKQSNTQNGLVTQNSQTFGFLTVQQMKKLADQKKTVTNYCNRNHNRNLKISKALLYN